MNPSPTAPPTLEQELNDLINKLLPWRMVNRILKRYCRSVTPDSTDDEIGATEKQIADCIIDAIPKYYVDGLVTELEGIAYTVHCDVESVYSAYTSAFCDRYIRIEYDEPPYGKIFLKTIDQARKIAERGGKRHEWLRDTRNYSREFAAKAVAVASGRASAERERKRNTGLMGIAVTTDD